MSFLPNSHSFPCVVCDLFSLKENKTDWTNAMRIYRHNQQTLNICWQLSTYFWLKSANFLHTKTSAAVRYVYDIVLISTTLYCIEISQTV